MEDEITLTAGNKGWQILTLRNLEYTIVVAESITLSMLSGRTGQPVIDRTVVPKVRQMPRPRRLRYTLTATEVTILGRIALILR